MPVPNQFPINGSSLRIALVGEAPGTDETREGLPFVGKSGRFLNVLLSRAGTSRESCFVGNLCQVQPPRNEISSFDWMGDEIQSGIAQLRKDLELYKPNIIVALGGSSLHLLKAGNVPPRKHKKQGRLVFNYPFKPSNWRGSLFASTLNGTKAMGTYHPAYVLRDYEAAPLLQFDLKRAVREASTPNLRLPARQFCLKPTMVLSFLEVVKKAKQLVAIDIEGGINSMSCISFATSPEDAFIVPFFTKDLNRCFDFETEKQVWRALADVLEDPEVPKVLQNSLYDRFVLQYCYKIRVRGVVDDIMLKHWEKYSELEKALDVQASIYTDEPYYKGDRKSQSDDEFFSYCCRDSAVTYEINTRLDPVIHGTSLSHYRLNRALLHPLLYCELRGIRYDSVRAASRRADVRHKMHEEQARLNGLTGYFLTKRSDIFTIARDRMAYKKAFIEQEDYDGITTNAKKAHMDEAKRLAALMHEPVSLALLGELEDLLGLSLNTGSNKVMVDFLYRVLDLPMQYNTKRQPGEEDIRRPTADYEALLKLTKHCIRDEDKPKLRILTHCIEIRSLATRERMLSIHADEDGRIRCGYNVVGTDTGRITCYESPTGSGYNLQTIPKYDRDLFVADEDHWMFQCDLSGADGWTVAAYCAMLGDRTMLDDYLYGLKPAKILVLALKGERVDFADRSALKEACKHVDPDSWDYFAMKRIQHGCCLTRDHDVLTKDGWVPISDVNRWSEIMVYDQNTKNLFFEKPKEWHSFYYDGELYEFEGNNCSIQCTASHRIPVSDNGDKVFSAKEVFSKKSGRIPYSGNYVGGNEMVDARLFAAYHADGCGNEKSKSLDFHFRKERKINRLIQLVKDYDYKLYNNKDGTTIISVKIDPGLMQKHPGAYMLKWTKECLQDYVHEIMNWDANVSESGTIRYFSVDKKNVGWIQTFAHLVGKGSVYQGISTSGFGSTVHRCSLNNREFTAITTIEKKSVFIVKSVNVFCPTVSTGFFLYRRNNKIGITGNSYVEGPQRVSDQILTDSEGKFFLPVSECKTLRDHFFFKRYPGIPVLHRWMQQRINERPTIIAASGQVRHFFGRREELLPKAMAFEPQANTTYATNLALYRLWTDPENRVSDEGEPKGKNPYCRLRVEPIHQVHDALIGQFKKADTTWAVGKIKSWFDNTLNIAGQRIVIPFEGAYGESWGSLKEGTIAPAQERKP